MVEDERSQSAREQRSDYIDFKTLALTFWQGRLVIVATAAVFLIVTSVIAFVLTNMYEAEALLAPTDLRVQSNAGIPREFSGLASLAGIEMGEAQVDQITLGLETLKSRKFIRSFIERRDILVPLMAAGEWNATTGELSIDSGQYDVVNAQWVRDVSPPRSPTPSHQEAYEFFVDRLTVDRSEENGLITLKFTHRSPVFAQNCVTWLIEDINEKIRESDVKQASQAVEFLNAQLENTSFKDLHAVFFRLIEEEMATITLAEITDEYFLTTVDPPVIPEEKAGPNRLVIVVFGLILGLTVGGLAVFARSAFLGRQ